MRLENEFVVPADVDTTWTALNDLEWVVPCFPGATLDSVDSDQFTGSVKLKLGSISMVYKGSGTFTERDESAHRVVISADGRDSRGQGTAQATVTTSLRDEGGSTRVTVVSDLKVTGKVAQFGRGVMNDVAGKILTQFADCLAGNLS